MASLAMQQQQQRRSSQCDESAASDRHHFLVRQTFGAGEPPTRTTLADLTSPEGQPVATSAQAAGQQFGCEQQHNFYSAHEQPALVYGQPAANYLEQPPPHYYQETQQFQQQQQQQPPPPHSYCGVQSYERTTDAAAAAAATYERRRQLDESRRAAQLTQATLHKLDRENHHQHHQLLELKTSSQNIESDNGQVASLLLKKRRKYLAPGSVESAPDKEPRDYNNYCWPPPQPADSQLFCDSSPNGQQAASIYQQAVTHSEQPDEETAELDDLELETSASGNFKRRQHTLTVAAGANSDNSNSDDFNQIRLLEMRKEKSRDAARSRRSKENHEFYELAKLLPLPAAITSQLDFLDKASIIRLTISFLKLRQFSVNGHPPWAPNFTTLASANPYASGGAASQRLGSSSPQSGSGAPPTPLTGSRRPTSAAFESAAEQQYLAAPTERANLMIDHHKPTGGNKNAASLFDIHQGTHILQSLDGFAFAIGHDGRFLYISETVSMYLGLSQVEMTGSSVFDYTHQQDHEELARQLGMPLNDDRNRPDEGQLADGQPKGTRKRAKLSQVARGRAALASKHPKLTCDIATRTTQAANQVNLTPHCDAKPAPANLIKCESGTGHAQPLAEQVGTAEDPFVRQFCIRMKSTLTKRGCQHFKSSGYRVVHVVAHLRRYQSNDHGHLMDPFDEQSSGATATEQQQCNGRSKSEHTTTTTPCGGGGKRRAAKVAPDKTTNTDGNNNNNNNLDQTKSAGASREEQRIIGMVAVAIALPPPSINELRLESETFVLKLGLDLRISHVEPKITELLSYPVELVAGQSLYSFVHPGDVHQVQRCHRDLLRKGQMMSGYYRLLARTGGYIWVQSCATLICATGPTATAAAAAAAAAHSAATPTLALASPMAPPTPGPLQSVAGGQPFGHLNGSIPSGPATPTLPFGTAAASSGYFSPGTSRHHQQQQQHLGQPEVASTTPTSSLSSASSSISLSFGAGPLHQAGSSKSPANVADMAPAQDQDQCVIFVNHIITDLCEPNLVVDICQSSEFKPAIAAAVAFAANSRASSPATTKTNVQNFTSHTHNNRHQSPPSDCSSPASLKTPSSFYAPVASVLPPDQNGASAIAPNHRQCHKQGSRSAAKSAAASSQQQAKRLAASKLTRCQLAGRPASEEEEQHQQHAVIQRQDDELKEFRFGALAPPGGGSASYQPQLSWLERGRDQQTAMAPAAAAAALYQRPGATEHAADGLNYAMDRYKSFVAPVAAIYQHAMAGNYLGQSADCQPTVGGSWDASAAAHVTHYAAAAHFQHEHQHQLAPQHQADQQHQLNHYNAPTTTPHHHHNHHHHHHQHHHQHSHQTPTISHMAPLVDNQQHHSNQPTEASGHLMMATNGSNGSSATSATAAAAASDYYQYYGHYYGNKFI